MREQDVVTQLRTYLLLWFIGRHQGRDVDRHVPNDGHVRLLLGRHYQG